jgi:hypothetical protein
MRTTPEIISDDLDDFVSAARSGGVPDETLVPLLRYHGWSERRVYGALSQYYRRSLGMALPVRSGRSENARDAFMYLVNFITLGFWATALGQILTALIARRFPDFANDEPSLFSSQPFVHDMAWQFASVAVALPIFAVVNFLIREQLRAKPEARESGVRLWLTCVALVVAAVVCMSDAIWFLEAFLRGELSIRFVLDSSVLALLGGGIFGYYASGLQHSGNDR